jgi:hypothetical protein
LLLILYWLNLMSKDFNRNSSKIKRDKNLSKYLMKNSFAFYIYDIFLENFNLKANRKSLKSNP